MVMPCSRSASRPSTSSAKSTSLALRAVAAAVARAGARAGRRAAAGLVQQAADQRALAVVDAAAGDEAQSGRCSWRAGRPTRGARPGGLVREGRGHRCRASIRSSPPASSSPSSRSGRGRSPGPGARDCASEHLGDHLSRAWRPRIRSRRSADSSPACGSARGAAAALAGAQRQALVVDHDQRAVALAPPAARAKYSGTSMFSRRMYSQTSSSVQFDSGNTRTLSPFDAPL
jgi:hypothetical protein